MDELLMLLQAKLDEAKSKGNINSDIKKVQGQIDKLKVQAEIDPKAISNLVKQLEGIINQKINITNINFDVGNAQKVGQQVGQTIANATQKEIDKVTQKANKIQLSFANGDYNAKVESTIAKTQQWRDENGNARISTEQLRIALTNLGTAYNNLNADGGDTIANQKALKQAESELSAEIKKVTNEVTKMNAEYAKSSKVESLHQKLTEFYDKNSATHKKWGTELKQMMDATASGAKVTNSELLRMELRYKEIGNEARQTGKLGLSFFDSIREQAKKFTQWVSVASVVTEGMQTLREMKDAVVEVNSAMIELKKVSNASDNEIKNYFDEAAESAKRFGSSISDVINATADFSRLGYNLKDASVLAEVATLYKNVGDGITIDEASSSIVSTMKAFGIEAENAMQIIDSFNEVGNNFAISSGEIGDALKRSASSLAVGGNSLSEAIGLITAGNTVVQDADTVGTALKSMSLRITSTSAELEAMGEDTEFACETLSDYRDLVMGLTDNKVNIVGDSGEYKSTYEILKEISKVWDDMNSMEQSSLMKALFGVRQANIGASILENFDVAEEAMKAAEESAGSALKEQENYEKGKHICLYV